MQITLSEIARQVRRDILRMVAEVSSGHPGASLGCADFLTALYFDQMKHDVKFKMDGHGEDVFFLSNGHISPLMYSVLARVGYFPTQELKTFRRLNSRLQGHPTTHEHLPGIRIASGSLGQGMSVASGMALAKRMKQDEANVFSLHGDGELQEGQIWEAAMFAAHYKLDNLISTIDYNHQQIDGPTEKVMSLGDLKAKFIAFGWQVLEVDGNKMDELIPCIQEAKSLRGGKKPICILMRTIMGKGVDFMENDHNWHGTAPNAEQLARALAQLPPTALGDY